MNATVGVNMLARAVLREQRIPFEITGSVEQFYSVKNQARLKASIEQLEAGKGTAHDLIEADKVVL